MLQVGQNIDYVEGQARECETSWIPVDAHTYTRLHVLLAQQLNFQTQAYSFVKTSIHILCSKHRPPIT